MSRSVVLINPYDPLPFEPGHVGRYQTLAGMLAEKGYAVTWVTGGWAHSDKRPRRPGTWTSPPLPGCPGSLRVVVLPARPYRGNVSLARVVNHVEYALRARRLLARLAGRPGRPDVAIISLPPLSPCFVLTRWLERRGTRVIIDIQDLWPEALAGAVATWAGPLFAPLRRVRNRCLDAASRVVAVSQDYLEAVAREPSGSRAARDGLVCRLGVAPEVLEDAGPEAAADGTLHVAFAGSLSRNYDLGTVLQAAELAGREGFRVSFTIMGEGPLAGTLRDEAARRGLDNVVFTGRVPHEVVGEVLRRSHAGLNAITPVSYCAFPNKAFDYLASGCYIVNSIGGGELERLLEGAGAGTTYRPGDPGSLLSALRRCWELVSGTAAAGSAGWHERRRRIAALGRSLDRRTEYRGLLDLVDELAARSGNRAAREEVLGPVARPLQPHALVGHDGGDGLEEKAEVEAEGPAGDVGHVELDAGAPG